MTSRRLSMHWVIVCVLGLLVSGSPATANEIWVAPTYQADVGGVGIGSNGFWPVTVAGAVRLAWSVPNDLQTFQSAKVVLIPHTPGGAATLNVLICPAQNGDPVAAGCAGPFTSVFVGVPNQLVEVDISAIVAPRIGTPGATYLAVVAYTTPTTSTDHIVGLRFDYAPTIPTGVAILGANSFSGSQTAPSFIGSGASLTGVAKLGANTFTGAQTAPSFVGSGTNLTGIAKLGANTFIGAQTAPDVNVTGKLGIGTTNPLGTLQIGADPDALFRFEPSDASPNAGFVRFGDSTGWRLHFGRSREASGGPLNTGFSGVVMTLDDRGSLSIGNAFVATGEVSARVNDAFSHYIALSGRPFLCGACGRATLKTDGPEIVFSIGGKDPAWMDSAGVLHQLSSRAAKHLFRDVDAAAVLAKIERLPLMEWSYKDQDPSIRHIGPFAEDFHELFGLGGDDDKTIPSIDPSGVALVGVKAVANLAHDQQAALSRQEERIKALEQRLQDALQEIEALKQLASVRADRR